MLAAAEDPFLGSPFQISPIVAGANAEFKATLIQYPFQKADNGNVAIADSTGTMATQQVQQTVAQRTVPQDSALSIKPKAAVLYVHGYNDYYFQKELAIKTDSAGYAFFAIDLHGYGRSLGPNEHHGFLRDMADYYPELDSALGMIQKDYPDVPVVLLGHSTGGLLVSLYAQDRDQGKSIAAIVLNSPFYEMNKGWLMRNLLVPAASKLGQYFPDFKLNTGKDDNYARSIHKSLSGEWDFDQTIKLPISPVQDLGWLHAIHSGHTRVQEGLNIQSPILLMHSNCSIDSEEWVEEFTRCDGVLNVEHISTYGKGIGTKITEVEIQDGLHDLFLSKKIARENAYRTYLEFLDQLFLSK